MRRLVARRLLVLTLIVGVVLVLLAVGPTTPVLFMAPWLLVLAPLLAGRYVGERSLHRLARDAGDRRPRRRLGAAVARRRPTSRVLPRGGRLIGCSLAVRPPPVPA
jgi:hypothetical protein